MTAAIRRMQWRWRVAIVVAAIVGLVAVVATRGNAAQGSEYRTAIVSTGDVTQTLTASGSVDSASRYDLTFQVAGDVDAVDVKVGDVVEPGQELATLDDTELQDAVSAAQDALTEAQSTLSDDLGAQSSGSTSSSSTSYGGSNKPSSGGSAGSGSAGGSGAGNTGGSTGGSTSGGSADSAAVKAAEQAVKDAQQALLAQYDVTTQALSVAAQKQADAQTICADFTALDPADAGAADALVACQDATNDALAAQQEAAAEQSTLMDKASTLNDAVTALVNAIGGATAAPAAYLTEEAQVGTVSLVSYTTSRIATAADDFSGGSSAGGSQQTNSVPSAEDILADEADVSAAKADLAVAQAQLDYATLSTPVGGTVISVGMAAGSAVSAGDTTTAITVIADNTYLVNLSVSLTQARMLAVGQPAKLTLLSDNQVVDGTVSSVSTLNGGNSFSQAYAVTIAVPDPGFAIRIGTATRMEITVADATDVLVVPTSAVSDATGDATVQVIGDDGTAQTTSVTTGAVGAEYTEITGGLENGQEVVLADLSFKLSTGDDDSSSTGGLLSGLDSSSTDQQQGPGGNFQPPDGFPGGGQGGGGFGGPPTG